MWVTSFLLITIILAKNVNSEFSKKTINFTTTDNDSYQFTELDINIPEKIVNFQLKTDQTAYVCITETFPLCKLEISFGTEDYTNIQIIKNNIPVAQSAGIRPLNKREFRGFWIKWTRYDPMQSRYLYELGIKVGAAGSNVPIVTWNDTEFYAINYFGFKSAHETVAQWKVEALFANNAAEITNKTFVTRTRDVGGTEPIFLNFDPIVDNRIIFAVKTSSDACIALTRTPTNSSSDMVVIKLGRIANTMNSVITKSHTITTKSVELSRDRYKKFIIDIIKTKEHNVIKVTRGDNTIVVVGKEKSDNWQTPFKYFSLSADYALTAYWLVKDHVISVPKYYSSRKEKYHYFPINNQPFRMHKPIRYSVKGSRNAYIALAGDNLQFEYQIMVGAYGNKRTIIRKKHDSKNEAWKFTEGILKPDQWLGLWIDWAYTIPFENYYPTIYKHINRSNIKFSQSVLEISVGIENDADPILTFRDSSTDHQAITHFGIATYESEILFAFKDIENKSYINPHLDVLEMTDEYGLYEKAMYFETTQGENYQLSRVGALIEQRPIIQFNIRGRYASICLSEKPFYSIPNLEIDFGDQSTLSFNGIITNRYQTLRMLDYKEFNKFWLSWEYSPDALIVEFGRYGEEAPLMKFTNNKTIFKPQYFGVKSGLTQTYLLYKNVTSWEVEVIYENMLENKIYEYDMALPFGNNLTNVYEVFKPIHLNMLTIEVKARSNVWLKLSALSHKAVDTLEIVIGGSNNTKSFIRKFMSDMAEWYSAELDQYVSKTFYIKQTFDDLRSENLVEVKRSDGVVLMSYREPRKNSYKYYIRSVTLDNETSELVQWITKGPARTYYRYYTTNNKQYQYFKVQHLPLQFKVKGSYGARVALSTKQYPENGPDFEVYIGSATNSKFEIFKRHDTEHEKSIIYSSDILNDDYDQIFWITWYHLKSDSGPKLHIRLGYEGKPKPLISYIYNGIVGLAFCGVASEDTHIQWEFEDTEIITDISNRVGKNIPFKNGTYTNVKTKKSEFKFFSALSKTLVFNVKSVTGVHIILSPAPHVANSVIEIFIGYGNSKSFIVRSTATRPELYKKVEAETIGILHGSEYRGFVISWDEDLIRLNYHGISSPIVSWKDLQPFTIDFVGIGTEHEFGASWQLESTVKMLDYGQISYFAISSKSLSFAVRAVADFQILLFSSFDKSDAKLEIVIGSEQNTKSYFKKGNRTQEYDTKNILDNNILKDFWLNFQYNALHDMIVEVGESTQDKHLFGPFMTWYESNPFPVTFVGISTKNVNGAMWGCSAIPASDNDWYKNHNCYVRSQREECSQSDDSFIFSYVPDDDDDDNVCDSEQFELNIQCRDMLPRNRGNTMNISRRDDIDSPKKLQDFIKDLTISIP